VQYDAITNDVTGNDFQWRMTAEDTLTGQLLLSDSRNPDRPDLAPSLAGQALRSHAWDLRYDRSTRTWDGNLEVKELGDGFRVDDGFEPQVGFRQVRGGAGYTLYPAGTLWNRIHLFLGERYTTDTHGGLLMSRTQPSVSANGFWNSYMELDWNDDRVRVGNRVFGNQQVAYVVNMSPSSLLSQVQVTGFVGKQVDYDNVRPGRGALINLQLTLRPTDHLTFDGIGAYDWLDVTVGGRDGRLFTATIARLRASYTFTACSFLRLIGQDVRTVRRPDLYLAPVARRDDARTLSALFGYRLNWQTVLFLGYGDESALDLLGQRFAPLSRTVFLKISYAFQR
jgi:hypothetical protein